MSTNAQDRPRARVAEGRRNRRTLLDVATRAFASGSGTVTLESIARDAGLGIGTLYRHFPTRLALVEAVYEDQIERLEAIAEELLRAQSPALALREWMNSFLDWAATKQGMVDALRVIITSGRVEEGQMRRQLIAIVARFLDAGSRAGDLRSDVDAADVAATLAGVLAVAPHPRQRPQAERMLDLLIEGLRPRT
jgi:AcrR family transcriptional regulator